MAHQRLLERLRNDASHRPPGASPEEIAVDSILSHVHDLLCTRKGTVPIADDFGMPDVFFSQGVNYKQSSHRMTEAIVAAIRGFEPRLKNVVIEDLSQKEDLLKQRFGLRGDLTNAPSTTIEFEVIVSSEAKITVTKKQENR
ncbi:MAG: type VI secretion system baseplate subunit TssE [Chitinispirillaceae bacterium]|nr:type VI secretion system baseplate subunit TssE [Chitinispirillaceae bacterium]